MPRQPRDPEARALRNINVTLYAAALLLVAAASLFIGIAIPAPARFLGLVAVTALFYAGGLVMHARSRRLRPAAAAFTGTGLALLPVTGLASYLLVTGNGPLSWLATSAVGTAAFVHAGARLRSKVLALLSLTFLVSTAWAGGAVLNRGMVWYFGSSMALAALATVAVHANPRWMGNTYLGYFRASHRYLVPAVLVAALLSVGGLTRTEVLLVFASACLYYGILLAVGREADRWKNLLALRIVSTVTFGLLAWRLELDLAVGATLLTAVVVGQAVAVAHAANRYARLVPVMPGEAQRWMRTEAAALLAVGLVPALLANAALAQLRTAGWEEGAQLAPTSLNWALLLVLAGGTAVGRRLAGPLVLLPLAASLLCIFEPWAGAPWRQALFLGLGSAGALYAAGRAEGRLRALVVLCVRITVPLAVAAAAAVVASGFRWRANEPPADSVGMATASLGVLTLCWLTNSIVSAAWLWRALPGSRRVDGTQGGPQPGQKSIQAVLLPLFLLAAALHTGQLLELGGVGAGAGRVGIWALLAVGLLAANMLLGGRWSAQPATGRPAPVVPALHAAGLVALAAPLFLAGAHLGGVAVEVVLLAATAHGVHRAGARDQAVLRGAYALFAQAAFSLLLLHVADRLDADVHARWALLAASLAAGQCARLLLGHRLERQGPDPGTLQRPLGGAPGLRATTTWLVLGLLLALSPAYLGWVATSGLAGGGADRAALAVQLASLGGASLCAWRLRPREGADAERWTVMGLVAASAGLVLAPLDAVPLPGGTTEFRAGGWLPEALWDGHMAVALLLALASAVLLLEAGNRGGVRYRPARLGATALYLAVAALAVPLSGYGWWAGMLVVVGSGSLVFGATCRLPDLAWGAAVALPGASLLGAVQYREWREQPLDMPLDGLVAGVVAAGVLELASRLLVPGLRPLAVRLSWAVPAVAGAAALPTLVEETWVLHAGAAVVFAAAMTGACRLPRSHREAGLECVAVVGAALFQRSWWVASGGHDVFWAVQYWVLVLVALAGYELWRRREGRWTVVLGMSAGLLSASGLSTLPTADALQQTWALLGHAALLVLGLFRNHRVFLVWGAVGIGLAVLWYLRGHTFLLLALLGAVLIGLALWRLTRIGRRGPENEGKAQPGD